MAVDRAQYDNGRNSPDDHWIFEELGSPQKLLRKNLPFCDNAASKSDSDFGGKVQVYAKNMRKLITAARAEINSLLQQNTMLKQKLESSGVIECPACLLRFKPKRMHRILPKYIKVLRGRLSLEIEFTTLDEMNHWLIANQLDSNSDGLPTMVILQSWCRCGKICDL
ncbi:hypothetical protein Aduo_003781 [Ancylostoma duodenale]